MATWIGEEAFRRMLGKWWRWWLPLLIAFGLVGRLSGVYLDWLWFGSIHQVGVFWTTLTSAWGWGLASAGVVWLFAFANLLVVRRSIGSLLPGLLPLMAMRWLTPRLVTAVLAGLAALPAVVAGLAMGEDWLTVLAFLHQSRFGGAPDPVFHRDVGFYVFSLPFYSLVYQVLGVVLFLVGAMVAGAYLFTGRLNYFSNRLQVHPQARKHLALLAACYFALKAWGYWLDRYQLLYSQRGVAFGASFTDLHVNLPVLHVLVGLALLLVVLALAASVRPVSSLLIGGFVLLMAVSFAGGNLLPAVVEQLVVKPSQISRETPYIENDIAFTRRAYNLEAVQPQSFPARENLTAQEVLNDQGTIGNIRLWDWRALHPNFQQLQGLRLYYNFDPMNIDRYPVGGQTRQVLLSAREIAYSQLPEKTWINIHLKYTHGYGLVMTPASESTSDGLPAFWVKDIPPSSSVGFRVREPRIYFGQQTDTYAVVDTNQEEFDYPQGSDNAYTRYTAKSGIGIGSLWVRLAFVLAGGDYNLLFSGDINADSQLLLHRNLQDRIKRVAPYLTLDQDPYIVIGGDGTLSWIQDAYTTSSYYPYARPYLPGGGNYIRNAVKVVVNAYSGEMQFYLADPTDPLIRTYAKIFPGLYRPLATMPSDLKAHVRYPEDYFAVQVAAYGRYHMTDPQVFYNSEDLWVPANEIVGNEKTQVSPYYVNMALPGETQPEFMLMQPFTPNKRDNMVGWIAARSDPPRYGQLVVYAFPKDKNVLGPMQIESSLNSTPEISSQITLWNQQGSQVYRGNLLVIPINDSILYVEPLYLQSASAALPRLQRVVVAYNNQVVMQPTLAAGLNALFKTGAAAASGGTPSGAGSGGPAASGRANLSQLAARANQLYQEAQAALRQGNWAVYGSKLEELGQVLKQLQAETKPAQP